MFCMYPFCRVCRVLSSSVECFIILPLERTLGYQAVVAFLEFADFSQRLCTRSESPHPPWPSPSTTTSSSSSSSYNNSVSLNITSLVVFFLKFYKYYWNLSLTLLLPVPPDRFYGAVCCPGCPCRCCRLHGLPSRVLACCRLLAITPIPCILLPSGLLGARHFRVCARGFGLKKTMRLSL